MDAREYLQPDFDPSKYKVAQLRNVLLQNDVSYPSHAKKQDLINLFNEHIKPSAKQDLEKLNNVVADDRGIEIVEKKEKKELKVEKKRAAKKETTPEPSTIDVAIRKSPRKTSRSTKLASDAEEEAPAKVKQSPRKSSKKTAENEEANELGKIPLLKVESPPQAKARERSPSRKVKSKEPKVESNRERSPARKAKTNSSSVKSSVRDRSPLKRKAATGNSKVKTKSEVEVETKSQTTTIKADSDDSDDEDGSDVVELTQETFEESKSPFKVGAKFDSSFTNENVFQSPGSSSPDGKVKKTIPKKRSTEANSTRSPRKVTKSRKTAFSSSPEPQVRSKSPLKKSLEISKFEASSPPSNMLEKEFTTHDDIFNIDESTKYAFQLDSEIGDSSLKPKGAVKAETPKIKTIPIQRFEPTPTQESDADQSFNTPQDGNASRISNFSSPHTSDNTPIKRRSLIPDLSKLRVSQGFAKTLSLAFGKDSEKSEETKDKKEDDPELLEDEEQESGSEGEHDDTDLLNLQKDIEEANKVILEEAEEAVKQVNEIFGDQKDEDEETDSVKHQAKEEKISEPFDFKPLLSLFKQLFVLFFFASVVISTLWYREQRILVGYCGSEINQPTFPNTDNEYLIKIDDFLQDLKPSCLKCPENAICLPSFKLKCKQDYIVREPWYKLYGVLPFSDYCVKDKEKENIIAEVVSKSLELLRTRNANVKCGDGDDFEVGISDDELYEFFFNSKKSSVSNEEFDDLWERVINDLENEPEITLRFTDDNSEGSTSNDIPTDETEEETDIPQRSSKVIFRSNSTLKLSIKCKFKKEIYETFQANKTYIIGFGGLLTLIIVSYYKFVSYQQRQSKIKEISDVIITKLQKQQKNSITDPTGLTNRYLSTIQLRDELLSSLKNSEKFQTWSSILSQLEKNSNVRSSTKEIHGEIVKVLEWIGEVN